ncbi:MAG: hypothetical protein KDA37_16735 [Planctomycetales bacterium]|nr:hypothetical protein [Planctomycetales bacterium]
MSDERTDSSQRATPPFVNAASVAWALSGFAAGSLVVGIAAVEFLGPFSRSPRLERAPQVVPVEPKEPAATRPVVLPSMSAKVRDADEPTLFSAPGEITQGAPSQEPISAAALPTELESR